MIYIHNVFVTATPVRLTKFGRTYTKSCVLICVTHTNLIAKRRKKKKNSNEQIQVKEDRVLYHSILSNTNQFYKIFY